jgi:hypothetical protein
MVQDDGFSFSFYLDIKVEANSDRLVCVQVVFDQICSYRYRSHNISIRSGDQIKLWLQNSVLVRSPRLPLGAIVALGFSDKAKIHVTSPRHQLDLFIDLWSGKSLLLLSCPSLCAYPDTPTCAFNVDDSAWFDEPQPSAPPVQPVLKATSVQPVLKAKSAVSSRQFPIRVIDGVTSSDILAFQTQPGLALFIILLPLARPKQTFNNLVAAVRVLYVSDHL